MYSTKCIFRCQPCREKKAVKANIKKTKRRMKALYNKEHTVKMYLFNKVVIIWILSCTCCGRSGSIGRYGRVIGLFSHLCFSHWKGFTNLNKF